MSFLLSGLSIEQAPRTPASCLSTLSTDNKEGKGSDDEDDDDNGGGGGGGDGGGGGGSGDGDDEVCQQPKQNQMEGIRQLFSSNLPILSKATPVLTDITCQSNVHLNASAVGEKLDVKA